jgi:hypothetical protein
MRYSGQKRVVIVIDALDEGYNTDLLAILRDQVPKLLITFRIFLTSRAEEESWRSCHGINIPGRPTSIYTPSPI